MTFPLHTQKPITCVGDHGKSWTWLKPSIYQFWHRETRREAARWAITRSILYNKWHSSPYLRRNTTDCSGNLVGSPRSKDGLPAVPHLPLAHPVSWAAPWLWVCWRPGAGTARWALGSRAPAPLSEAALWPLSAWLWRERHPPEQTLSASWATRERRLWWGVTIAWDTEQTWALEAWTAVLSQTIRRLVVDQSVKWRRERSDTEYLIHEKWGQHF